MALEVNEFPEGKSERSKINRPLHAKTRREVESCSLTVPTGQRTDRVA